KNRVSVWVSYVHLSERNRRGIAAARRIQDQKLHAQRIPGGIAQAESIYLERNASLQAQAIALGGDVKYLHPEEARAMMDWGKNSGYQKPWELWKKNVI